MKFLKTLLIFVVLSVVFTSGIFVPTVKAQAAAFACETTSPLFPPGMSVETCKLLLKLFEGQNDGPWYNQNFTQFAKKVAGGDQTAIFGERYTFAQINWIINSIATMLNPASGMDSPNKLFEFIKTIRTMRAQVQSGHQPTLAEYSKLGPMGLFAGGVTALYTNPPASGVSEVKHLASEILDLGSGVTPAFAQGYGFTGLGGSNANSAVRTLWTASRNMAYLLIVIILIAAGFLIMFRVKINPQTVVSLQTMIPKLIITLILITFSFAIAGLVIDLIYVFIAAFVGFMSFGGIMNDPSKISEVIGQLTSSSFGTYLVLQASTWLFALIVSIVAGIIGFIFLGGIFPGLGQIAAVIGAIVLFLWLNITFIKIFIMLIKAYVTLILQICIAPLQIMLDLIPGQQGFGPWIRNLIANASVFAVIPIMLFIQYTLSWGVFSNASLHVKDFRELGGTDLQLPYVELAGNALGNWNYITPMLIGLFIFSMAPKIADMIRDILKIPAFKYGAAFTEALSPYKWVANQGLGYAQGELGAQAGAKAETAKSLAATRLAGGPGAAAAAAAESKARVDQQRLEAIAKGLKIN